jgi:competence protein ComEA
MRTMRWIAVVAAAMWCAGAAAASDEKPARADTRTEDSGHHPERGKTHVKGEHKAEHHKVNINEASKADLMTLEGVSAGVAQKIIAYREAHGVFKHAHDLEKVAGVSKEVFEKNPGRITVK